MSTPYTYVIDARKLKPVIWLSSPVYRSYDKLKSHLRLQLGDESALLFAKPFIQEKSTGELERTNWYCEGFSHSPTPLNLLPQGLQETYKNLLQQKLTVLLEYSQRMLESDDAESVRWGQLINKSLDIPGEDQILCGDGNVVLVAWGFTANTDNTITYSLRKNFQPIFPAPSISTDLLVKPTSQIKYEEQNTETPLGTIQENPSSAQLSNRDSDLTSTNPVSTANANKPTRDADIANSVDKETLGHYQVIAGSSGLESSSKKASTNDPHKPSFWAKWKRLWWALPLLLILIFLAARQCGPISYLPKQPGVIIPIDTTKIVLDPAKVRYIVTDRLNIVLTGSNKDVEAFAKAFKNAYPNDDYRVIYYDPKTYRLQLEIPPTDREQVKKNLSSQLSGFKMWIFYEGVIRGQQIANDPGFTNQLRSWYHTAVQVPAAWQYTQGDNRLVVAVVDQGFDLTHPEISNHIVHPYNVLNHSPNLSRSPMLGMHGTHVAGIAIGTVNNGIGLAGIAPNCRLMPVQVGDPIGQMGTTSVIDGFLYAIDNGASVVNMSLGMRAAAGIKLFSPEEQQELANILFKDEELFWNSLFDRAEEKNVSVVLAAGNDDVIIGLDPMQRSEKTFIISATDQANNKADFSNYGNGSTLSAPGVRIFSSVPDRRFAFFDGTSMAAPIVAGGVALLKSVNPTLTFRQLKSILQQTGLPIYSLGAYVGNLIQLGKALEIAARGHQSGGVANCSDVQRQIDSLLLMVEQLKQSCDENNAGDTLKLPPINTGLDFAVGRWKSTSDIVNNKGEFVELYFDFQKTGTGTITLREANGTQCSAPLAFGLTTNEFHITQRSAAICSPPPQQYASYSFGCQSDANGHALCTGQNQQNVGNNLRFNLVKIQ
ncbi:S8 family serine peptidase [Spirosoma sp. KCTC 42546]|uniref:S8 family serine peptidase n=1 Tax=Spirosoma sp. KCTC 42546 TaxID=2520506 RepID=UPI001159BDE8|nr:S8 family serine peptidase [Spirosoma sp. KCTC 42546]QDK77733.1 S8 family serine peptidase [Spirosoma sp. KCTC 42546]